MKKNTRPVNTVLMHLHLDEVMAYYIAYTLGVHYFDGIKTAKVEFTSKVPHQTIDQWIAQKTLSLGAGGDVDEHRNGKVARAGETCATVIMADMLTLQNGPIWDMIREVNRFDGDTGCPKSHLASLLKAMKISKKGFDQAALRWAMKVLAAVQTKLEKNLQAPTDEKPFLTFVKGVVKSKITVFTDPDALQGLYRLLEVEAKRQDGLLFGLRNVYESLWRTACSADERANVTDHMLFALDVLYKDQTCYHTYARYINSLGPKTGKAGANVWFTIDVSDGTNTTVIDAAAVKTDNPQAHTVLRSNGAVVSIVVNSLGNVTIQGDKRYARGEWLCDALDNGIADFCAMNRFGDMTPKARMRAVWSILRSRGHCPGDEHWYLADEGWLALFNGTHNHQCPPTTLSLVQLRKNATNAFNPMHVNGWKNFMRVPKVDTTMELGLAEQKGLSLLEAALDQPGQRV